MRGRKRKRYYLEKSDDAGLTYRIVAESDDLDELKYIGDLLDLEPIRWVIKDRWTRSIVDISSQHMKILSFVAGKEFSREDFEPFVIPSEQIDTYETKKKLRQEKLKGIQQKYLEGEIE